MSRKWNEYPIEDGQIIYDQNLDKNRQIGLASLALYRQMINLAREQYADTYLFEEIKTIAIQMRYFIVGNNNASLGALNFSLSKVKQYKVERDLEYLVDLCLEIVKAIIANKEYVEILLNGTEIAGIYSIEQKEETLEANLEP